MEGGNAEPPRQASGRTLEEITRDLSASLQAIKRPTDFVTTLFYSIPSLAPIRICIETGIFATLAEANGPRTASDLANSIEGSGAQSADEDEQRRDFVVRMLRVLCAVGLVDETAAFTYTANDLTRAMADPGMAAGFKIVFDNSMGPTSTMSQMVAYHKLNGWKGASSANDGPWQRARDVVGQSTFDYWVEKDPEQLTRLNVLMQRMQRDRPHWSEWFPAEALLRSTPSDQGLRFVDVGGGRGHDLAALAARYPHHRMTLVLQDLPSVIDECKAADAEKLDDRISLATHDFFKPQPVQGADVYYMHKIMHDWPDEDCVKILTPIKDAMDQSSRIFINDVILSDQGCPLMYAAFDIDMLALHSGRERDQTMWNRLIDKVGGLKIVKFWLPPGNEGEGMVEVAKAE